MRAIPYTNRLAIALAIDALVSLGQLNLFEHESPDSRKKCGRLFSVILDGDIPALIYLGGLYRDEWKIAVALWPGVDTPEWVHVTNAPKRPDEAYFCGWLNRWQFQGTKFAVEMFHDTCAYIQPEHLARVSEIVVPNLGVAADLMSAFRR